MKTIEFYITLPSGQQLLDVIEWEDGECDEVYTMADFAILNSSWQ